MRYLILSEALELYNQLMGQSGGAAGIRDLASVESATAQNRMTLNSVELHPTVAEKAV